MVIRLLGNREDAKDLVQDTFAIGFDQLSKLRQPETVRAWLAQIGVSQVRRKLRRVRLLAKLGFHPSGSQIDLESLAGQAPPLRHVPARSGGPLLARSSHHDRDWPGCFDTSKVNHSKKWRAFAAARWPPRSEESLRSPNACATTSTTGRASRERSFASPLQPPPGRSRCLDHPRHVAGHHEASPSKVQARHLRALAGSFVMGIVAALCVVGLAARTSRVAAPVAVDTVVTALKLANGGSWDTLEAPGGPRAIAFDDGSRVELEQSGKLRALENTDHALSPFWVKDGHVSTCIPVDHAAGRSRPGS